MKTLDYFRLEINKTKPRNHNAISVDRVDVAAMNDRLIVIKDDNFTRINIEKGSGTQARTLSEASAITLKKNCEYTQDLIFIEMYCHCSTRVHFIRHCNEILVASKDYSNYYVNSLGDVQEITHDND